VSNARQGFDGLPEGARLTWLGHASILTEIDGTVVLVDPLFGSAGPIRRVAKAPILPRDLPRIDAVVLTHGHHDHLDLRSLRAVAKRFPSAVFITPVGLSRHLPWACKRRVELSWWRAVQVGELEICLVPAQHWHLRTGVDYDRALWGGVVLRGSRSVYHSGDSGYFGGFKTIGRVFPELDVAVLPMGAYEPRWFMEDQHMAPEHSVQAFDDVGARFLVPMHWGTFDLSDEPLWHGPIDLLPQIAREHGIDADRVRVLPHGGTLAFGRRPDAVGGSQ
jgi:L-ascorbate metabolism protein UlaG (beta-lactamase superfamily)